MTYLIPIRELDQKTRKDFRGCAYEAGISRAMALGIQKNRDEFTVRELLPSDVGLKEWVTDGIGPQYDWINTVNNSFKVISIYKILILSPDPGVSRIHFWKGGSRVGLYQLDGLCVDVPFWKMLSDAIMSPEAKEVLSRMTDNPPKLPFSLSENSAMEGYLSYGITYDPQEFIRISLETTHDQNHTQDLIMLGGFVIEPKGMTIV